MRASWLLARSLFLGLMFGASRAAATDVVVLPLEPDGVEATLALDATRAAVQTLRRAPGIGVIEPERVEEELGVGLVERARACSYDVFCLVELAELTGADRLLFGRLTRSGERSPELTLRMAVIDVEKAAQGDVVVWSVPPAPRRHVDSAARAAARRLFTSPNARIDIRLTPRNARLFVYGQSMQVDLLKGRLWPGAYLFRVEADGFTTWEREVVLVKGPNPPLAIQLSRDPLAAKGSKRLDQPSLAVVPSEAEGGSAFAQPIPWVAIGVGVAGIVLGSVLMKTAQDGYNDLAAQERYRPGRPVIAATAREDRDGFRTQYAGGSIALGAGAAAVAGAFTWMAIDELTSTDEPESSR